MTQTKNHRPAGPREGLRARLRSFRAEERGLASVGAIIWIPFFMSLITLAVDASLLMLNRGDMWRVAGETARQLAIGAITPEEAASFVNEYSIRGADYSVSVATTTEAVSATVSVPISMVSVTAWFMDSTGTITVEATQRREL